MEPENVTLKYDSEDDYCQIVEDVLEIKDEDNDILIDNNNFENNLRFKCGICGHQTASDFLLNVHMKIHLVTRIHLCKICNKAFKFVTELNSHMLSHTENRNVSHLINEQRLHENNFNNNKRNISYTNSSPQDENFDRDSNISGVNAEDVERSAKKFKTIPYSPMNIIEKMFLLECVEKLGLHKKYQELEEIKNYIKNCWQEMVTLFMQKDYDRNSEKLSRTYFQLKNQAKTHIERFYKFNKGPEPHKLDYIFVKLCPAEFQIPGIDIKQLEEDVEKYTKDASPDSESKSQQNKLIMDDDKTLKDDSAQLDVVLNDVSQDFTPDSECSRISVKKNLYENSEGPPNKIQNMDTDLDTKKYISSAFDKLKLKNLLADERRKEELYEKYLRNKEELFNLEKKHMEEMHKKDLEIKEMELLLLRKKVEIVNSGS